MFIKCCMCDLVDEEEVHMLIFCFITHTTTCFSLCDHHQMVLTGVLMFCYIVNCWLLQLFILLLFLVNIFCVSCMACVLKE
jgi:GTP cyclohydrolase I